MAEEQVGNAYVPVRADLRGFHNDIRKALRDLNPDVAKLGEKLGKEFGDAFRDGIGDPLSKPLSDLPKHKPQTTKGGEELGGSFADGFKRRVEAAFKSFPEPKIGADATEAEAKISDLRRELKDLSGKTVGVDIDADAAIAELERIRAEYDRLDKSTLPIDVRANITQATAQLDALRADLSKLNGETVEPTVEINLDPAGQARLAKVRGDLDQLAARVAQARVTASTDEAQAKLSTLEARLLGLDRQTARPDVDLKGVAEAEAALFAVSGELDNLNGKTANVRVSTNSGAVIRDITAVKIALAALATPVVIPLAIAGAGTALAAGSAIGAGIGGVALASLPGIKRVTDALTAQKTAQDQVTKSTTSGAVAADQARIKSLQMAGAQDALRAAEQQAAEAHRQAVQQVQQAEQSLTAAQNQARQAQEALNQARKDAAAQIAAYKNQLIDARLAERGDALAVAEAEQELQHVRSDPTSTQLQIARAQLNLDVARQSYKEQKAQTADLAKTKAAADKAGVKGSAQVVAAQQQVRQANQGVQNAERTLSDARANVARTDANSARQVREAQRAIAQQMAQNKLATDQAAASANTASAATSKYGLALGKLTKPERSLLDHVTQAKKKYDDWAKSLEAPIFNAFGIWLDTLVDNLGLLNPAITGTAGAIGKLGKEADKSLKGKFWTNFSKLIGKQAGTDTYHLGHALGNVTKGLAGIVEAFLPYAPGFFRWLDKITGKFANWATGKKGKQDFGQFMAKAKQEWPTVKDILRDLWKIAKNLGDALGGMSPSALKGLENILALIGKLSPDQLQALLVVGGGAYVGSKIGGGKTGGKTGGLNLGSVLGGIGLAPSAVTGSYTAGKNAKGGLGHQLGGAATAIGTGVGSGALIGGGVAGPWGALIGGAVGGAVSETAFGIGTAQNALKNFGGWWNKTLVPSLKTDLDNTKTIISDRWNTAWSYVSSRPRAIWNGLSGWWNKTFIPGVGGFLTRAKNAVVNPWKTGWNYVTSRPKVIWRNVSTWFTKSFVPGVRSHFTSAKNKIVDGWRSGWSYVLSRPKAIWHSLSTWFSKSFVPGVRSAFSKAVHAISTAWGKIASATKTPINFVIRTVYDRGIKGTWDKVASWLHLGKKWQAPYIKPLAEGGVLGGGAESHVAQIAPAGAMRLFAEPETGGEAYIPMSPRKRGRSTAILNTVANEFGYNLLPFADGGIFGWVKNTFSNIAGKVTNFGKSALGFLTSPVEWLKGKVTGAINKIPGVNTPYGQAGKALSVKVLDQVTAFAKQVASVFGAGGAAMKALKLAETRAGVPYVYGGTSWGSGMDCSGLTMLSYRKAGIDIPRTSEQQWGFVRHISLKAAQPGDLVFTEFGGAGPGHVGFRTQYPYNSPKATFNEPHTGAVARYRPMAGWTAAGVVPGAHVGRFNGVPGSTKGGYHAGPGPARAWAKAELPELGWGGQFSALNNLWNHESSWRWYAANPSGAYGIPQALPASKMASAGSDWRSNAYTQEKWGLGYIRGRYGSPNKAWSFWQRHNYYDNGGYLKPGLQQVVNATGKPEPVLTPAQWDAIYTAASQGTDGAAATVFNYNARSDPDFAEYIHQVDMHLRRQRLGGVR